MNLSNILNVKDHIKLKIPIPENKSYINYLAVEPVLFQKLLNIKLWQWDFRVTTFFQFASTKIALSILLRYANDFNKNLEKWYSKLVINNAFNSRSHNERPCILSYSVLINSSSEELTNCKAQIMQLTRLTDKIFATLDPLTKTHQKRYNLFPI